MFEQFINIRGQRKSLALNFIQDNKTTSLLRILKRNSELDEKLQFGQYDWREILSKITSTGNLELLSDALDYCQATTCKLDKHGWFSILEKAIAFSANKDNSGYDAFDDRCNNWRYRIVCYATEQDHQSLDFFNAVLKLLAGSIKIQDGMWGSMLVDLIRCNRSTEIVMQFFDKYIVANTVNLANADDDDDFQDDFSDDATCIGDIVLLAAAHYNEELFHLLCRRKQYFPDEEKQQCWYNMGQLVKAVATGQFCSLAEILNSSYCQHLPARELNIIWFDLAAFATYRNNIGLYKEIMQHCVHNDLLSQYDVDDWIDILLTNLERLDDIILAKPQGIRLKKMDYGLKFFLEGLFNHSDPIKILEKIGCYLPVLNDLDSYSMTDNLMLVAIDKDIELFRDVVKKISSQKTPKIGCSTQIILNAIEHGGISRLFELVSISVQHDILKFINISPLVLLEVYLQSKAVVKLIQAFGLSVNIANKILQYAGFLPFTMNLTANKYQLFKTILQQHNFHWQCFISIEPKLIDIRMLNIMLEQQPCKGNDMFYQAVSTAIARSGCQAIDAIYANKHANIWNMLDILSNELNNNNQSEKIINAIFTRMVEKDLRCGADAVAAVNYYAVMNSKITQEHTIYLKYVVLNNNPENTKQYLLKKLCSAWTSFDNYEDKMILVYIDQMLKLNITEVPYFYDIKSRHIKSKKEKQTDEEKMQQQADEEKMKQRLERIAQQLQSRNIYLLLNNHLEATVHYLFGDNSLERRKYFVPSVLSNMFKTFAMPNNVPAFKLHILDPNIRRVADNYQQQLQQQHEHGAKVELFI